MPARKTIVTVRVEEKWMRLMRHTLKDGETPSAFIRRAIRLEVKRRQKQEESS